MKQNQKAFTIVELLVVIVVIGVLASIALVSYTGISKKATIATITSDLDNAYKKFKLYQIENSGYPTGIELNCTTPITATNICLKPSPNNQYTIGPVNNTVASNQTFCLTILNASLNTKYRITSDGTQAEGECPYILTASGTNGTVTGSGEYTPGTTATITATPNSGYLFSSWSGDVGCVGDGTFSHTITMDANKNCTANFVVAYTLTVNYGTGGTATGGGTFVSGSSRTITATPSGIYVFNSWTGAGCSTGTVIMDSNKTCTANFVVDTANWTAGVAATALAGKYVYKTDASGIYRWDTSSPGFTAGCAAGGRWPDLTELQAIYANRASYGTFISDAYYSSTAGEGPEGEAPWVYYVYFGNGNPDLYYSSVAHRVRCIAG